MDSRDKYNSLKKDNNKLLEDKLRQRWEKDAINIRREVGEKRMTRLTNCHIPGHIGLPDHVLNLHPQSLLEAPQNVKQKEKDENECLVTGCTKRCHYYLTSHGIPDNHLKLYASEYRQHDLETWSTLEEDNGKGEIHWTCNDTLERLMETVQYVCSESEKSCQESSLLTNNESELAKLITKSLTELSCNDERGIERFEEFVKELKESLTKTRGGGGGGGGGESLEEEEQFLKALLDYITYTRSLRNTRKDEVGDFTFNKNHNLRTNAELLNIPRTSTRLIDNNLLHKRHNTEILNKLMNFEIISVTEKKRRDDSLLSSGVKDDVLLVPVGAELKEHSLLLKKMKLLPQQQQLYKAKSTTSGVHEQEEGKRKRRMKLSRVTREIRARMRRKTEQKREDLAADSSDEN